MEDQSEQLDSTESGYYPNWLGSALLNNGLPWDQASAYTVQAFLEKYTLHDSLWVNLIHDVANENHATLAIMWDAVWLPDEIAKSTDLVNDWPILFIRLEQVRQISTLGYEYVSDIHRGIATAEIEEIDSKKVFVIHDHYRGSVEIVFEGQSLFLALNVRKAVLKI